jgi:putative inorganic carbon (hco3(-)) transporter
MITPSAESPLVLRPADGFPIGAGEHGRVQFRPSRRDRVIVSVFGAASIAILMVSAVTVGGWTLGVGAAAAATLLLIMRPDAGGPLFAAVLILNLPAIAVQYYGVPSVLAGGASGILFVPVVATVLRGHPLLVRTPALPWMFVYLLALIVSSIASTATSEAAGNTLVFVEEGAILYFLVTSAIRTEVHVRRVIWTVVLAGGLLGAISISQEARHAYGDTYFGLAQTQTGAIRVDAGGGTNVDRPRLAGPIGETNRYAQVMLILLPLAMFLVGVERRRGLRLLALACSLAILAAIALTFSRGAILVLAVLVIVMCLAGGLRWRTLIGAGLVLSLVAAAALPGFVDRVDSLRGIAGLIDTGDSSNTPDGAIVGRATSNLAAVGTFIDHPIIGVGPGVYYLDYSRLYANRLGLRYFAENRRAHDMYLEIAADTGTFGLAAFLAICGVTLLALRRAQRIAKKRSDRAGSDLAKALFFAMLAFLGTGAFLHLSYERYFWFLIALANVVAVVIATAATHPAGHPPDVETEESRASQVSVPAFATGVGYAGP